MKTIAITMCFLLTIGLAGCSKDGDPEIIPTEEEDENSSNGSLSETDKETASNSIIGVWELKTLCYPEGNREIPSDYRDLFIFSSSGKVTVVIKKVKPLYPDLPNEDGEYDYSYDKEKQMMQFWGKTRGCIISDGEMRIEGYHSPDDGLEIDEYIFIMSEPDKETASDSNSIMGIWELKTLCYPEGNREIPSDYRDSFTFSSSGKVTVVIKKRKPLYPDLPNENGEYDYSYDKEKKILQLCGESLKCVISDDEMHVEGYHHGPDDGVYTHEFIFKKKQI